MKEEPDLRNTFGHVALIFGVEADATGWIDEALLVPLAGSGRSGRRCVTEALSELEHRGLVERDMVGGRHLYRRTNEGLTLAGYLVSEGGSFQGVETETILGLWNPPPGAPASLDELVGQEAAKHLLRLNVAWAQRTKRLPANMLFFGPSGSGKTLLASVFSREARLPFIPLSAAELDVRELQLALDIANAGALIFIDELQAASKRIKDQLLVALDPEKDLPFTAVGATTDPGALSLPLRRRFEIDVPLEEYTLDEAQQLAVLRSQGMGLRLEEGAPLLLARAARSNPARVVRLLKEAAMLVEGTDQILQIADVTAHLDITNRDERGVDGTELDMLLFLRDQTSGAAGIGKFADALGLDKRFVRERLHLLRKEGLLRSHGTVGHCLTSEGTRYLSERGL